MCVLVLNLQALRDEAAEHVIAVLMYGTALVCVFIKSVILCLNLLRNVSGEYILFQFVGAM